MSKPLFVPLKAEHYDAFANGSKTYELRRLGRQWTEKHIYLGRKVTLSYGYGKGRRLSGSVQDVLVFDSARKALDCLGWHCILPKAGSRECAVKQACDLIGDGKAIAFLFRPELLEGATA